VGKSSSFRLSKWYLDCIAEDGDGIIVYIADLHWTVWQIRYASTLRFSGNKVETASSVRKCSLPEHANGRIALELPHLGVEGVWTGSAPSIERTIFENSDGAIQWNCLQPAAQVTLRLNRSTDITGTGYAELLEMSIPPWKLPLEELHWGRFITDRDRLVWIDWRGPYSRRVLVHNGNDVEAGAITEGTVGSLDSNLHLALDRRLVLRSGPLGDTIFSGISNLARALPAAVLGIRETKWRSHGTLNCAGRAVEGWAIHEVVGWKK